MPKTSQSMLKAIEKYQKEKTDGIMVRVPKGKKEDLKAHAAEKGESLNGFVNRAINETLERDKRDV